MEFTQLWILCFYTFYMICRATHTHTNTHALLLDFFHQTPKMALEAVVGMMMILIVCHESGKFSTGSTNLTALK